jgi:hypothetical protein
MVFELRNPMHFEEIVGLTIKDRRHVEVGPRCKESSRMRSIGFKVGARRRIAQCTVGAVPQDNMFERLGQWYALDIQAADLEASGAWDDVRDLTRTSLDGSGDLLRRL